MSNPQQKALREELQARLPEDFPPLPEEITAESITRYVNQYARDKNPDGGLELPEKFDAASLGTYIQEKLHINPTQMIQNQAKIAIRGALWSLPLSVMPMSEHERRKIRYRLQHGESVGVFEFMTGSKMTPFRAIRSVVFAIIAAVVIYVIWHYAQTNELPAFLQ